MNTVEISERLDVRWIDEKRFFDPAKMEKIFLIQAYDAPSTLCAIGVSGKRGVFFEPGNMSFHSTGGGKLALDRFVGWVKQNGLHTELKCASQREVVGFGGASQIDLSVLKECVDEVALQGYEQRF